MKKVTRFVLLTFIVATFACKKNKDTDPDPVPYGDDVIPITTSDYSQLKVGNYWIYQEYDLDSTMTIATPTNVYDSCYISETTTKGGNTYYKISGPLPLYNTTYLSDIFLRDSADCIIDYTGRVRFSLQNFSTPLYTHNQITPPTDTISTIVAKMVDRDVSVTVPAGTFLTVNSRMDFYMHAPYDKAGKHRIAHQRFAAGVGLVSTIKPIDVFNRKYKELRLVRYHLN